MSKFIGYYCLLATINVLEYEMAPTYDLPPTCDSEIYCYGKLLHTVQMAEIFNDSKTFVDMIMLEDAETILSEFQQILNENNGTLSKQQVSQFVEKKFTIGTELTEWQPNDFNSEPAFLEKIIDSDVQQFAKNIVSMWPKLGRKMNSSVLQFPHRHSIIPLPHGIIIPGGRFHESYYWDSYWIINGLLVSEMIDTARGLLNNFVYLIQTYGFIPNGGRVYYTRRSQPPLFTSMCMKYFKRTGDTIWLRENINYIEKELLYWRKNTLVKVKGKYMMARYFPESQGPRAESYKEDYIIASHYPDSEQQRIYTDLKGGAESGWDFSSRWFYNDDFNDMQNLLHINTQRSVPVDLNSFLCKSFRDIAHFYLILDQQAKHHYWYGQYKLMKNAIYEVFWNSTDGIWYDYDLKLKQHRNMFYISNLTPLWAGVEHQHGESPHELAFDYLARNHIFDFMGGTPTSLQVTGEQWDLPNAWAPLQDIVINSLHRGRSVRCREMAGHLANLWIHANMIGYNYSGELYEKYDAVVPGMYGGGGEYTVQSGFGWTNGLALDLINKFFVK